MAFPHRKLRFRRYNLDGITPLAGSRVTITRESPLYHGADVLSAWRQLYTIPADGVLEAELACIDDGATAVIYQIQYQSYPNSSGRNEETVALFYEDGSVKDIGDAVTVQNEAAAVTYAGLISARAVLFSAEQDLTEDEKETARSNIGLENVDNTADSAKPVSIAAQAALDLKANLSSVIRHDTAQSLTGGEQTQARANIGAMAASAINSTNNAIPYRSSSSQFSNSPLSTNGTDTSFSGVLRSATHAFPSSTSLIDLYRDGVGSFTGLNFYGYTSSGTLTGVNVYLERKTGASNGTTTAGAFSAWNWTTGVSNSTYGITGQATNFTGATATGFFGNLLSVTNQGSLSGSDTHGCHINVTNNSGGSINIADVIRCSFRLNSGGLDVQEARGLALRYWIDNSSAGAFQKTTGIYADNSINLGTVEAWFIDSRLCTAKSAWGGSHVFNDGVNIEPGTTTGSKIGTTASQKLGFWNATPVAQQVLATGAGATSDNIISLLQTIGLCRQS